MSRYKGGRDDDKDAGFGASRNKTTVEVCEFLSDWWAFFFLTIVESFLNIWKKIPDYIIIICP